MIDFHFYILNDAREVVAIDDPLDWASRRASQPEDWHQVAFDEIGKIKISTVFLGVNTRPLFDDGDSRPPIVFETAMFTADDVDVLDRYSTYAEALEGHARIMTKIRETP